MFKIVLSACFLVSSKYNGKDNYLQDIADFIYTNQDRICIIPVCPEQLGGLSTPREPAAIQSGTGYDVITNKSSILTNQTEKNVTPQFISGAEETLKLMYLIKPDLIVFKENSPSCGVNTIYNVDTDNKLVKKSGSGVTAQLLKQNGFTIISENEFIEKIKDNKFLPLNNCKY